MHKNEAVQYRQTGARTFQSAATCEPTLTLGCCRRSAQRSDIAADRNVRAPAVLLALVLSSLTASAADWPQWRGPNRDGVSVEKGLLKEWPKDGPALHWKATNIGRGYSTPAVVGDRLYVLASQGTDNEFVEALSVKDGKKAWSTQLGAVGNPKQQPNFPTARSTPTVEGAFLYALSSDGDLACLEVAGGKVKWKKSLRADFGGKPGHWAYAESPLVDGDTLVCTPGGSQATIVALNKNTGELIWKCTLPEADDAAYASAIIVEAGGVKQYVQLLQKGLVGVDAKTGKFLWRYGKPVSVYDANIPTPVAAHEMIFAGAAGTGGGAVKLTSKAGTINPDQIYFGPKYPTAIGGAVKVGDFLYGSTGQALQCIEFATGEIKWEDRSVAPASLCYADGMLLLHGEGGEVALAEASPAAYREHGRFAPPGQPEKSNAMEKAWAYPIVANGRLYIRDHDSLWCFDVK
jgi:outer membrane protein assembly factor BamB